MSDETFDPMWIAVVGMAGRFPGAKDLDTYWRLVRDGVEGISTSPSPKTSAAPNHVQAGGWLEDVDLFDAAFFDFNPREAEVTDPQQRLLLEGSWQALEQAACDPEQFDGTIGVFAGVGMNTYFLNNIFGNSEVFRTTPQMQVQIGADKDYAAARISYKLNLRGPSVCVQSACSTGLVAVHMACQSLQDYQCDFALAGGATVLVPQGAGYPYQEGGIYSPDGHCRPFDAQAAGTVPGSGMGVVALRRLEDAYAEGQRILAVIRGSALSNDGNTKVGFTAPSMLGQVAAISEALTAAAVQPESIGYIEAHGTGTALGDPIEVAALAHAFADDPRRGNHPNTGCALGSVKSNIGHTDTAAGVAGLIKTILALRHRRLPPSLHFTTAHPEIDFSAMPFFVNATACDWPSTGTPRRAGVSSFGVGGTNAHAVLEEAPPEPPSGPSRPWQILLLTARDHDTLEAVTERLADHLTSRHDHDDATTFADLAHTTRLGRKAFAVGRALVCRGHEDAVEMLRGQHPERLLGAIRPATERPLVFLFPGQGTQYLGMAKDLYQGEPTFRHWFERAAEGFLQHGLGIDLRSLLYANSENPAKHEELMATDRAQAALFAVEYALTQLLLEWGLKPAAMVGHSIGEYVAACVAGVFDFKTALALVAARGRLMKRLPAGEMLSVHLSEQQLASRLATHPQVDLAATNGPEFQVVSGPSEAIDALAIELTLDGLKTRRLRTSHAFHSAMVEPILEDFAAALMDIEPQAPQIPFLSNLSGTWITAAEATDRHYWVRHLRQTVRFGEALEELFKGPEHLVLEVGPGHTLATLARNHKALPEGQLILGTLRSNSKSGGNGDQAFLLRTLARLWLGGAHVDWRNFVAHEKRRFVELPPYPLKRQRFWIDPPNSEAPSAQASVAQTSEAHASIPTSDTTTPPPSLPASQKAPKLSLQNELSGHPRPPLAMPCVAPRDECEESVARVWCEALGLRQVGVHDDFFELGGHSLLATQISARLRQEHRVDVPLTTLFERPTVAGMAAILAEAVTAPEICSAALGDEPGSNEGKATLFEALPTVVPNLAQRGEPFPLTDVQQAYWIGRNAAFDLGGVATHTYSEFDMPGVELEALRHAWRRLIARHEMLRAIVLPDGRQQILAEVPPYQIELLDLVDRSPQEAREELTALRERLSSQVLPSDRWPLFELCASRTQRNLYRLHFSFDLLIGDAWSWDILARELQFFLDHPESELPPFELSFRDYVITTRKLEETAHFARDLAYWQERLPTFPGAPQLPLAVHPSSVAKPRFVRLANHLEADAWGRIKERATARRLTPSGILLAAFAEVLATWSKTPHFAINLTLFNRLPLHSEVDRLLGDFTSLTLLEVDGCEGSFTSRAQGLQKRLWQDLDHRLVSGVRVLRELARLHGTSAQQMMMPVVFTSTLNMVQGDATHQREEEMDGGDLPGSTTAVDATREDPHGISQTPQVWIDHQVQERSGALYYNWDVVEDLFPDSLLQDMFRTFTGLLRRLAASEECWEEDFPLQLPEEQLVARTAANATAGPVPSLLLHQPFFVHAARHPQAPAVITAQRTWSYGQIAHRAHALALLLRQRGARPGHLVAITMEKGVEQVVAVLGVLEAGAAYLPVDPELPRQRRLHLYSTGEVEIVLTQSWIQDRLFWPDDLFVIALDQLEASPPGSSPLGSSPLEPTPPLPEPVQGSDDLAYVIFTSGSTGSPKGVMIEHRAAMNTILDLAERYSLSSEDRVFAISSLSFDLSVWDLFGPLSTGGALVLPAVPGMRDPAHWYRQMVEHGVSVWNSVPALMDLLVEHAEKHASPFPSTLRLVMLSGDWIPVELPNRIQSLAPDTEMLSLGGATEASIWSILYPIDEVEAGQPSIPYGKAMRNQSFHVLDHRLTPRPVAVVGELFIGGMGLARGYWRAPELTTASFFSHPQTGERLYRTGDLGRFLPDGNIQFLGREDFQVKIHGHRVELGEIESLLNGLAEVRESVVIAQTRANGEKYLAACFIPAQPPAQSPPQAQALTQAQAPPQIQAPPQAQALRDALSEVLPRYMVPSRFLALKEWPLNTNGKVDRSALALLLADDAGAASSSTPPTGELEEVLVELSRSVLGREIPGVHDDFFGLGGDSLMAVRLILEIRREFDVELPMRAFFDAPTVAGLANLVEEKILEEIEALNEDEL